MTHDPILRIATQGRAVAVVGDIYRFLATGEESFQSRRQDFPFIRWMLVRPPKNLVAEIRHRVARPSRSRAIA